jgi:hypothetical protein
MTFAKFMQTREGRARIGAKAAQIIRSNRHRQS